MGDRNHTLSLTIKLQKPPRISLHKLIELTYASENQDAKMTLTAPTPVYWKRPPGCPRITWRLNTRPDSLQPHTEQSSRPSSEPPSVEADVYVFHYAVLMVHARKEEEVKTNNSKMSCINRHEI